MSCSTDHLRDIFTNRGDANYRPDVCVLSPARFITNLRVFSSKALPSDFFSFAKLTNCLHFSKEHLVDLICSQYGAMASNGMKLDIQTVSPLVTTNTYQPASEIKSPSSLKEEFNVWDLISQRPSTIHILSFCLPTAP